MPEKWNRKILKAREKIQRFKTRNRICILICSCRMPVRLSVRYFICNMYNISKLKSKILIRSPSSRMDVLCRSVVRIFWITSYHWINQNKNVNCILYSARFLVKSILISCRSRRGFVFEFSKHFQAFLLSFLGKCLRQSYQ